MLQERERERERERAQVCEVCGYMMLRDIEVLSLMVLSCCNNELLVEMNTCMQEYRSVNGCGNGHIYISMQ